MFPHPITISKGSHSSRRPSNNSSNSANSNSLIDMSNYSSESGNPYPLGMLSARTDTEETPSPISSFEVTNCQYLTINNQLITLQNTPKTLYTLYGFDIACCLINFFFLYFFWMIRWLIS